MFSVLFIMILAISSGSLGEQPQTTHGCPCNVIEQALGDLQRIKPGMTRQDLERHNFSIAGGLSSREQTNYIYKNCRYIQLEATFEPDSSVKNDFSPKDVITQLSKLTLGYPVTD